MKTQFKLCHDLVQIQQKINLLVSTVILNQENLIFILKSKKKECHILCFLTSKWVLRMPFAGQNQFFDAKTTFWMLLNHKIYKITQKITKIILKGVYKHLGVSVKRCLTSKSWLTLLILLR